jgi:predicted ArsR family transcriptional regulator
MQSRRQEILTILKKKGDATVDELATVLELTPVTVRHHLDILRADGLVQAPAVRRRHGPGRPQYVYTLTEAAADHFPKAYDQLANDLMAELKAKMEPEAIKEILNNIAQRRLEKAPAVDPNLPVEQRVEIIVDHLSKQGFIANMENSDGNWHILVSNCPYQNVSSVHNEFCQIDHFILEELTNLKVKCKERISNGSHNCVYQIQVP